MFSNHTSLRSKPTPTCNDALGGAANAQQHVHGGTRLGHLNRAAHIAIADQPDASTRLTALDGAYRSTAQEQQRSGIAFAFLKT